jgi:hypothetical protein
MFPIEPVPSRIGTHASVSAAPKRRFGWIRTGDIQFSARTSASETLGSTPSCQSNRAENPARTEEEQTEFGPTSGPTWERHHATCWDAARRYVVEFVSRRRRKIVEKRFPS